jgi:lipopolysaccharide biosynthesis glycosyltransferase
LVLPDLFPAIERVIYLDCDMLALQSLQPLWASDLDGAFVGAVSNVTHPDLRAHLNSLNITEPREYFNAGVLLLDLARWRSGGVTNELRHQASQRPPSLWFDQDLLNRVFAGRWKHLHPRWNAMNSLWTWATWAQEIFGEQVLSEAKTNPAILHFEGPGICKPWHYLSDHPWRDPYRAMLAMTPWSQEPLEDRTLATMLIARLPQSRQLRAYSELHRVRHAKKVLRAALLSRLG